jgi:hypothetical protein
LMSNIVADKKRRMMERIRQEKEGSE